MADSIITVNRARRGARGGAVRRQGGRVAGAAAEEYFAPERRWLAARGPQIARLSQQVRMVTALVNAEKQFYDVSGNCNPIISPTAQYLCGIAEGDDSQGRSGRSIRAKELCVRLHFYGGSSTSCTVRCFIVKDNNPNGSVPAVGTLFQGGTATVDGMPVLDTQQGRFKWIFDETFVCAPTSSDGGGRVIVVNQKMDHHINYIGALGTTATAGQGALWLYVLTDVITGTPTGTYYSRLRYYDN